VDLLIAGDIYNAADAVGEDDKVSEALLKIEKQNIETIPVVKSGDPTRPAGILTHQEITQAYNTLLDEWETDQFIFEQGRKKNI
jgi:CBS domain-containing protein